METKRDRVVSGPRIRIVLVEDAELDVFLVREALERAGLEC
jgi:hypothetical protein